MMTQQKEIAKKWSRKGIEIYQNCTRNGTKLGKIFEIRPSVTRPELNKKYIKLGNIKI